MKEPTPIFTCSKVNGKMKFPGAVLSNMNKWIETLKEGLIDITIKQHTDKTTDQQRKYYFGTVVAMLADFLGYEKHERNRLHNDLKLKFNPIESKLSPGKMIGGSTKDLSKEEFFVGENSYVNRIIRYASDLGLPIPDPVKVE